MTVGLDPSYAPFEVVDGQGNLDGFDVDLTRAVAERLGVKASLVSIDFGGIYDALEVGKFDVIILGLGDNSHTASLFPHTAVLHEKEALVKEEYIEEVKMYRITLTAPVINNAHYIAFLLYGAGKADAVYHILEDERNIEAYPAQLIKPTNGELHWFMDEGAAGKLKSNA